MTDDGRRFAPAEQRWLAGLGGIRDVVRQSLVASQLDEALASRVPSSVPSSGAARRVLDVGCGQGTQALRLARLGHDVVGLDPSDDLLARFRADLDAEPDDVRGRVRLAVGTVAGAAEALAASGVDPGSGFDLVLCHGVLMYLDDDAAALDALTGLVAPGGQLSLLVRNGVGLALRPGLLGDWDEVQRALTGAGYTNRIGLSVRSHRPDDLDAALAVRGLHRTRHWGVRVLTDHRDGPPPHGDELAAMLAAERAVAAVDPYRQVAALAHLLYARPA